MKILVTGINGFIGRNICSYLINNEDIELYGVDINTQKISDKIKYIFSDISSENFLNDVGDSIESIDIIVHIAALIDFDDFNNQLIRVNAIGTNNILKLAVAKKCKKIIYISSVPVIGKPINIPITENHVEKPLTLYHITKLMGEHILLQAGKYGISSIVLRISSPIAADMPRNKILSLFIESCIKKQDIIIHGRGLRCQNYVDLRDVSQAVVKSLSANVNGIYNIASYKSISNIDLANLCKKITNSISLIKYFGNVDKEEDFKWDINIDKAKYELGYYPKYSIDDSIKDIIEKALI